MRQLKFRWDLPARTLDELWPVLGVAQREYTARAREILGQDPETGETEDV